MTATVPGNELVTHVPLDAIVEGPNYRKHYPDLERLKESIRELGILQPLIVRRLNAAGGYELVLGFCRARAARAAGLTHVPVVVRAFADDQVLPLQLAENHDRSDTHPLDDAAAFGRLRDERGWSIEEIAAHVRRSAGYVYGRLRLLDCSPRVLEALEERELPLLHAIEIARLEDHGSQDEVLARAWEGWAQHWTPLSSLRRMVAQHQHELQRAPWDLDDAQLVPDAGACSACPYRTQAQPELWPDEHAAADRCLRASCWSSKAAAHRERQVTELSKAHGVELAEVGVAPNWLAHDGTRTYGGSKGLVVLKDDVQVGGKFTTWSKAVKAADRPKPAGVAFSSSGKAVVVYREAQLAAAAGIETKQRATTTSRRDDKAARRRRTELARAEWSAVLDAALPAVRNAESSEVLAALWRLVLRLTARTIRYDAAKLVAQRRGWDKRQAGGHQAHLKKLSETLPPAECRELVIELLACEDCPSSYGGPGIGEAVRDIAAVVGIDVAAVRRQARADAKKPTKAPAAKPRAAAPAKKAAKRKNPWKALTPEQRLTRVNAIRTGRGLEKLDKLPGTATGAAS